MHVVHWAAKSKTNRLDNKFARAWRWQFVARVSFRDTSRRVDPSRGLWFSFGLNTTSQVTNLVALDLNTGGLVFSADMPFAVPKFEGYGQFVDADSDRGVVYVTGTLPLPLFTIDLVCVGDDCCEFLTHLSSFRNAEG